MFSIFVKSDKISFNFEKSDIIEFELEILSKRSKNYHKSESIKKRLIGRDCFNHFYNTFY